MPTYEYACKACDHEFEREQRITDAPVKTCPACGADKARRLISRTSFVLKGGGWYSDLYASSKGEDAKAKDSKSEDSSSSEASGGDSKEAAAGGGADKETGKKGSKDGSSGDKGGKGKGKGKAKSGKGTKAAA